MINETTTCPPGFPNHLWRGLKYYVLEGYPTGQFLEAVFVGNLFEVFRRGDVGSLASLRPLIMYLENECPIGCYGSKEHVKEWSKQGGLNGLHKEEEPNGTGKPDEE